MIEINEIKAVEDFLDWLENNTFYEIGENIQSDYGDGESYFNSISSETLLKEYKERNNWMNLRQELVNK